MGKGMRRVSWFALVLWLGCGEANQAGQDTDDGLASTATIASPSTANPTDGESEATTTAPASGMPGTSTATSRPASSAPVVTSSAGTTPTSGTAPTTPGATPSAPSGAAPSGGSADGASASEGSKPSAPTTIVPGAQNPIQASTLTAGTWDDNRNFERFDKYRKQLKDRQLSGMLQSSDQEHTDAQKAFAQPAPREQLDVSLVIDTTGSMGDEIGYLQTEFLALSNAIEEKYPNAQQRWSLVLYRDQGDVYVTRVFDFSDSATDFRDKLGQQSAGGGGDFPEAPEAALAAMSELSWRTEDKVARLAFWVADAPHHDNKAEALLDAIRNAREIGVHLYPVASSGVDELTEVSMRSAAQLTGGRYLFLTDDSGVGGEHKEPTIPCYFVTKLDKAILRMVDIEISGVYAEPAEDDIIRTGGDPKDGSCKLESGEVVEAF